ncbi:WSC-domain-containing protein [Trametes coccinea BRFM310]|uniref:WSC-domain-containing protein n=1 Tax=Trametes coccinea (strain BRFM310) TaxID=1353009 RepID=A0A1Y2IV37_TRAC3|nr:WSC-domain-containing protein [Trametes coccinea BRFM310]
MFARILSLVTLAAVANAYWTFGGTPVLVQTRLDSIVNPDGIGTHVHAITGASGFSNHYDYDQLIQSNCTTITVQADKSNYWMPQMYHRDKDTGAFVAMRESCLIDTLRGVRASRERRDGYYCCSLNGPSLRLFPPQATKGDTWTVPRLRHATCHAPDVLFPRGVGSELYPEPSAFSASSPSSSSCARSCTLGKVQLPPLLFRASPSNDPECRALCHMFLLLPVWSHDVLERVLTYVACAATEFNIYYLPRVGPKNESIKAFPKGFRMLAGDTTRRTFNASSFADQAIDFVCLTDDGSPEASPMPTQQCPGGLRAQVFFPSCWDGVNLDSPDHKSHVAYPIQAFNGGDCPDTHPVHLMSLFYEMGVAVNQFDFHGNGTWVLANGDTTGFGLHADFQNGWDVDLLQQAIDQCSGQSGNLADCAPLAAASDPEAAAACVFQGDLVDEPTGVTAPITALPGCNPVFGSGQDTSSCATKPNPGLVPAQPTLPEGWTEIGCIAEGTNGRALPALTMSAPNMTKEACAAFCASHNFTLAGAEFSDECYCDNALKNGASAALLPWTECANRCAGNSFEICGGGAKLTLMAHRASAHPDQPSRRTSRFERERV